MCMMAWWRVHLRICHVWAGRAVRARDVERELGEDHRVQGDEALQADEPRDEVCAQPEEV